jgi:hypothetical protein
MVVISPLTAVGLMDLRVMSFGFRSSTAFTEISGKALFASLVISLLLAVSFGTIVDFAVLAAVGAGQGSVIMVFGWVVMMVAGPLGVLLGYPVARVALQSGLLGYAACVLGGVALVGVVAAILFSGMGSEGLAVGLHYAIIYGMTWGAVFYWQIQNRLPTLQFRAFWLAGLSTFIAAIGWTYLFWAVLADWMSQPIS